MKPHGQDSGCKVWTQELTDWRQRSPCLNRKNTLVKTQTACSETTSLLAWRKLKACVRVPLIISKPEYKVNDNSNYKRVLVEITLSWAVSSHWKRCIGGVFHHTLHPVLTFWPFTTRCQTLKKTHTCRWRNKSKNSNTTTFYVITIRNMCILLQKLVLTKL